jgi:hypothetical protein
MANGYPFPTTRLTTWSRPTAVPTSALRDVLAFLAARRWRSTHRQSRLSITSLTACRPSSDCQNDNASVEITTGSSLTATRCCGVEGLELPPWSLAGVAATHPITDTAVDSRRGRKWVKPRPHLLGSHVSFRQHRTNLCVGIAISPRRRRALLCSIGPRGFMAPLPRDASNHMEFIYAQH